MRLIHVFQFEEVLYRAPLVGNVFAYSKPETLRGVEAPGFDMNWDLTAIQAYRRAHTRDQPVLVLSKRLAGKQTEGRIRDLLRQHVEAPTALACRPMAAVNDEAWFAAAASRLLVTVFPDFGHGDTVVLHHPSLEVMSTLRAEMARKGASCDGLFR